MPSLPIPDSEAGTVTAYAVAPVSRMNSQSDACVQSPTRLPQFLKLHRGV